MRIDRRRVVEGEKNWTMFNVPFVFSYSNFEERRKKNI